MTYGGGTSAELKLAVSSQEGDWAVVEWRVRAGAVPHGLTVRGEEARLLITHEPAGAEYFFAHRDDDDNDPAKFGLITQNAAPAM